MDLIQAAKEVIVIRLRNINSEDTSGFKIVLLYLLSFQIMYQEYQGGHITTGISLGPIGFTFNMHVYDNWLP